MIEKYGKRFDFASLGRNLDFIIETSNSEHARCRRVIECNDIIEVLSCPVCAAHPHGEYFSSYGFEYLRCLKCGHVFVKNQPADLADLYTNGSQIQETIYINEELFDRRCELISGPKVEFILEAICADYYDNSKSEGLWVDLGCGVGEILHEAGKRGYSAVGFDADPNEIRFAQSRGLSAYNILIDIPDLSDEIVTYLKDAKIVSLFNLIEHVPNPREWISTITSHMQIGSYLVIDTPREPSLSRVMNIACLAYNYRHMIPPEHINIFTEESLGILAKENRLEWVAKWCFGTGFMDLFNSLLLLSDNPNIALYDFGDILRAGDHIQKAVDESGLANAMLCVFRKV